jgi:uncharacterized protein (TIRG00374 family)
MKEKLKSTIRILIAIIISVLCVYYSIKDVELEKLWSLIANANYFWALLPIPVIIASHWIRAVRWRRILKPIKKVESSFTLFSAVMIGYFLNGISPRGGEFVRPYTLARKEGVSYSSSLATIVVERVIDLFALALLLIFAFLTLGDKIVKGLPDSIDNTKLIITGVLCLGALCLSFYPPAIRFILKHALKPFSAKLYDKIMSLFDKFVVGFEIIKSPSEYFMLIVESLSIWLFYTLPMYFMFFSFNFHNSAHLGFEDALVMIVVSGVATTIAPTPGAIGVYHVAIQNALVLIYGIDPSEAFAYATLTHAVNYFVQIVLGGSLFLKENINAARKGLKLSKSDVSTAD